jgi:hypothetical protein
MALQPRELNNLIAYGGLPIETLIPGAENGAVSRARSQWLWHVFMVQARDDAICALTAKDRPTHRPWPGPPLAATTLLAAGLLVSILDFLELPLPAGAVFLLTRDFFFIANVVSPVFI